MKKDQIRSKSRKSDYLK